jgi:hypothetical protein
LAIVVTCSQLALLLMTVITIIPSSKLPTTFVSASQIGAPSHFCSHRLRGNRQASISIRAAAEVSEVMLAKEFGAFQLRCLTDWLTAAAAAAAALWTATMQQQQTNEIWFLAPKRKVQVMFWGEAAAAAAAEGNDMIAE